MSCPKCEARMRVVHTQRREEFRDRWYRCTVCTEGVRTREYPLSPEELLRDTPPRHRRGSAHPNAVLTEDNVRALRAARSRGVSINQLATEYGLNRNTVIKIASHRTWSHVV